MSHLPDEVLACRAAAGHVECFEELLARYRVRVYRLCYRMSGNAEDAEDWAQECFVRAYRQIGHYDSGRPFTPWLLKVASNVCLNFAKMRARNQDRIVLGMDDEHNGRGEAESPSQSLKLDTELHSARAAIDDLTPVLRQAVVLWAQEELTFRELGEVLGVPLTTAAQRVRRALLQVRERLIREGFEVQK